MLKVDDITTSLKVGGLRPDDTVMIHGDALVAAQIREVDKSEQLSVLADTIIDYLAKDGTLIIPTFSYSFTNKEPFNVEQTPSKIGLFSEVFRKKPGANRSRHPIFSVVIFGKNAEDYIDCSISDCFGPNTIFDKLYKKNAKIMCLGCGLNQITFTHYIEQQHNVPYRFNKSFSGIIESTEKKEEIITDYFVRDLNIKSYLNLDTLKKSLIEKELLTISPIGRIGFYLVNSVEFFNEASNLLRTNIYSLIEEGQC